MVRKIGQSTELIHATRDINNQGWSVNPPIHQTSTVAFPRFKDLLYAEKESYSSNNLIEPYELKYGRYGTQTNFALEKAVSNLENGYSSFVTSSGVSAINTALFAFLKKGDHLLIVDNAYSPTRNFAKNFLSQFGVETTYFSSNIGKDISNLVKKNTKVIFMESPCSLTFELQDVPEICKVAKSHNIVTIIDNTWSSGIYFKPLNHGVDISVMSLTKYINGYSDIVMGAITLQKRHFKLIYESFKYIAATASANACYMVQRGLRTAKIRMNHASKTALKLAEFLNKQKEVVKVLYPALVEDDGHKLWKRDFTGAASIFTIILDKKYSNESLALMLDGLKYFTMGYSWGGFESLVLPCNVSSAKVLDKVISHNTALRISVGLEDFEDLVEDLSDSFTRLNKG